jgi:tRNA1Val (adenine37-N6)-methyltransferase
MLKMTNGAKEELTTDLLTDYDLQLKQPRRGYRFSLDPLLLCDFAPDGTGALLDLGTGCGVIPLVMARRASYGRLAGVEVQERMAAIAAKNVEENRLSGKVSVVNADILDLAAYYKADSFDLVMGNPPYRPSGSGRISPSPGRDIARHESSATLADFLAMAKKMVKPGGSICLIYHPERLAELFHLAFELKLAPVRLQMVHGSSALPARMFMIELVKGRKHGLAVLPPLLVNESVYGAHQVVAQQ